MTDRRSVSGRVGGLLLPSPVSPMAWLTALGRFSGLRLLSTVSSEVARPSGGHGGAAGNAPCTARQRTRDDHSGASCIPPAWLGRT